MLGERACMHVCVPANLSSSRSLFPSTCFIPFLTHYFFFFSTPQTQGFPWEARVGAWFTVQWNYGTGRLPNTRWLMGGFASLPRWWRGCFTSPADGDDLSFSFFFKGMKLWRARLWYALSPARRSKRWTSVKSRRGPISHSRGEREIKREERLSAVQLLRTVLWSAVRSRWPGPARCAGPHCWLWPWPAEGNMILKSFIISSFPLLNNTWR